MSDPRLEPPSDELAGAVDLLRQVGGPPPEVEARLLARLDALTTTPPPAAAASSALFRALLFGAGCFALGALVGGAAVATWPRPSEPAPSGQMPSPAERRAPSSTLDEERRLLEPARDALRGRRLLDAWPGLEEHRRRFPQGALAEEREALAIQALVLEGRAEEARRRAEQFRVRYPQSVLWPAVEGALGAPIP